MLLIVKEEAHAVIAMATTRLVSLGAGGAKHQMWKIWKMSSRMLPYSSSTGRIQAVLGNTGAVQVQMRLGPFIRSPISFTNRLLKIIKYQQYRDYSVVIHLHHIPELKS